MALLRLRVSQRRGAVVLAAVLGPLVAGLLLSVWQIGHKPLWYDETFEAQLVSLPLTRFLTRMVTYEIFGAPYHVLLWVWKFGGTNEAMLRLLSALAATAALPVMYAIARRFLPVAWASAAAMLLAVNGFWLHYAQEARPYALWLLLASLSTLALLRAVDQPSSRRRWLVYVVVTALAAWTHMMTAFMVLAHGLAIALHPDVRRWWRFAVVSLALAMAAVVPIALAIASYQQVRWSWMRPPTLERLWTGMTWLAGQPPAPLAALVVGAWLLGGIVVVRRWPSDRRRWWPMIVVLAWGASVALGPWLVSFVRLMYEPRYLLAALPPLILLAVVGAHALRPRPLAAVLLVALLAVGAVGVAAWYEREDRPDWRSATRVVAENATAADGVVFFAPRPFDGGALFQYGYYMNQFQPAERPPQITLPDTQAPLIERVEAATAGRPRLFVIASDWQSGETPEGIAAIETMYELETQLDYHGITVRVYDRLDGT